MSAIKKNHACTLMLSLAFFTSLAQAKNASLDYPDRPVTLVAPFAVGSVTDSLTRVLADTLAKSLNQPVIVENRGGAQGTIGAAHVAKAKPDGYTLLVSSSVMFVANSLFKKLSYDPVKSFTPVAGVASTAMMFLVPANSPISDIHDLAEKSRKPDSPISIAYGSPSGQVAVALFSNVSSSKPTAVSYRSIPQAITDMLGGHVKVAVVDIGSGLAQVNSHSARALAISAADRHSGAPAIPTLQEFYPNASGALETIIGVMAPLGTPSDIVHKLETALRAAMASDEIKKQLHTLNTSVMSLSADDFASRIDRENPEWIKLMNMAGITPQ